MIRLKCSDFLSAGASTQLSAGPLEFRECQLKCEVRTSPKRAMIGVGFTRKRQQQKQLQSKAEDRENSKARSLAFDPSEDMTDDFDFDVSNLVSTGELAEAPRAETSGTRPSLSNAKTSKEEEEEYVQRVRMMMSEARRSSRRSSHTSIPAAKIDQADVDAGTKEKADTGDENGDKKGDSDEKDKADKSDEDRDKDVDGDEKATEKAFQLDEEAMRKRNEEALARAAARRQVDSGDASAPGAEAAGPQTRRVRRAPNKMI